jgi:hypothetical protein
VFETTELEPREIDSLATYEWLAGYTYTVVITGYPNTDPLVLSTEVGTETVSTVGTPSPEEYQLRVIHALPDVGPLAVEMNGSPIVSDLAAGTSTDYITLPLDSVELTIREVGTDEPLLSETFIPTDAIRSTLFIYGSRAEPHTQIARDTLFEIPTNASRLRLFHGAPLQPALVAVYQQPSTPDESGTPESTGPAIARPISESIGFGLASEAQDLPAGTYDLQILDHDSQIAVVTMPGVTFERGVFYELLVLPDASGQGVHPVVIPHYD